MNYSTGYLASRTLPESSRSIAFYAVPQFLVDMIVERTGGRPIAVALPSLVDGEAIVDAAGSLYLVNEASDEAGSHVRR